MTLHILTSVPEGFFFQKEISFYVLETLVISSTEISEDIIARSESDYK